MEQAQDLYKARGYSDDLLPKIESQRNWKTFNYFTLWMGSVHNVPNYVMVGGFFILGLSTFSIMMAIILIKGCSKATSLAEESFIVSDERLLNPFGETKYKIKPNNN